MAKDNPNLAKPHTIKKFELMSQYAAEWAYKLLNLSMSEGIVFIDCMCNSGHYTDTTGQPVDGTPIRVACSLDKIAQNYPQKKVLLFFNDLDSQKIAQLEQRLQSEHLEHVQIGFSAGDANGFLKTFPLSQYKQYNKLLFYDPYNASIDWDAITPFLNCWGEVILNHMVIDTVRGAAQALSDEKVRRYERTYEKDIEDVLKIGNDRKALDDILVAVMRKQMDSAQSEKTYITSFPFHNRNNGLIYNLMFCSHNIEGFKLFKKTAWKTFGDKSSMRTPKNLEGQLSFNLDNPTTPEILLHSTDEHCYCVNDIAKYLFEQYQGQGEVLLDDIWRQLDIHPIFPSDGYKQEIKKAVKNTFGVKSKRTSIIFA